MTLLDHLHPQDAEYIQFYFRRLYAPRLRLGRTTFPFLLAAVSCVVPMPKGNLTFNLAHVPFFARSHPVSCTAATECQGSHWMNYLEAIPLYRWGIENKLQPFQSENKRSVCGHGVTQRSTSPSATYHPSVTCVICQRIHMYFHCMKGLKAFHYYNFLRTNSRHDCSVSKITWCM